MIRHDYFRFFQTEEIIDILSKRHKAAAIPVAAATEAQFTDKCMPAKRKKKKNMKKMKETKKT